MLILPNQAPTLDWQARLAVRAKQARHPTLQRFYQAGTVSPYTPLAEVPFVALDFETTGLNPNEHSIVSIGLVPFTLARIRLSDAHHWVVRPRQGLAEASVVLHGITHSEVARAPDLQEILEPLLDALAGRIVVVHHRAIERRFLDVAVRARLQEGLEFPMVDTFDLEGRLYRQGWRARLQRLLGLRVPSIRLDACRSRLNLPHYAAHNALVDALGTAELLQAQVAHRFDPHMPIHRFWH